MDRSSLTQTLMAAKAIFLLDDDTLCLVDPQSRVYSFRKGDRDWHYDEALEARFHTPATFSRLLPLSREQALALCLEWAETATPKDSLLDQAILYATQHHAGQRRKGTDRPYILHPLETMLILHRMNAAPALLAAGVLHDVLEDTDATASDLRAHFGDDITRLVAAHSEDKRLPWRARKQHAIDTLAHADRRQQMLVLADKVSNLRSMAADYAQIGEALWDRFNAGPAEQAWYYSNIEDAFWDLQTDPDCSPAYWEMNGLFKDLFVQFYLDPETPALYQICRDGTAARLIKGDPQWQTINNTLPPDAERLSRKDAEALEDQWNVPFWHAHDKDTADAAYLLSESAQHTIELHIHGGTLTLLCRSRALPDALLFTYSLDEDATHRFFARLRIEYGLDDPLPTLLAQLFDNTDTITCFTSFCQRNEITWQFKLA